MKDDRNSRLEKCRSATIDRLKKTTKYDSFVAVTVVDGIPKVEYYGYNDVLLAASLTAVMCLADHIGLSVEDIKTLLDEDIEKIKERINEKDI